VINLGDSWAETRYDTRHVNLPNKRMKLDGVDNLSEHNQFCSAILHF